MQMNHLSLPGVHRYEYTFKSEGYVIGSSKLTVLYQGGHLTVGLHAIGAQEALCYEPCWEVKPKVLKTGRL